MCFCTIVLVSCAKSQRNSSVVQNRDTIHIQERKSHVLVSNEELQDTREQYNARADELFDDFLYNFINDSNLRQSRIIFPLIIQQQDGNITRTTENLRETDLDFMLHEYTTNIYNNEGEKGINEDTTLTNASLEKIDLLTRMLTSFDFLKKNGKWNLETIRVIPFEKSDLGDFLIFYSKFSQDTVFHGKSLARSIHISMMDPDDESGSMDGFITSDQWNTVCNHIPEGIITNIRYGQQYRSPKRLLLEKNSIGNGMSEVFSFRKNRGRWELVGYEN